MRRIAAAGLLAIVASLTPVPAHAGQYSYRGGCHFLVKRTGLDTWSGNVWLAVTATDGSGAPSPLTTVSAWCELKKNGVSKGAVLGPTPPSSGATYDEGPLAFTAGDNDVVTLCDHVSVGGENYVNCHDATRYGGGLPGPVSDVLRTLNTLLCQVSSLFCDPLLTLSALAEYMYA
jgi:hypothetical protein